MNWLREEAREYEAREEERVRDKDEAEWQEFLEAKAQELEERVA